MKTLFGPVKHKIISVAIVSLGALLGFEALSFILGIYQIGMFVHVAVYIFLFHVFWLTFLFDLHLKNRFWKSLKERTEHVFNWHYFRHYLNFYILPGLIYWSVVCILFLNPFNTLIKQTAIVAGSFCMSVAYWFFKETYSRKLELHEHSIKYLSLVKLFTAFLLYSAVLGITWYFGYGRNFLITFVFIGTYALLYQALFQHKLLSLNAHAFMLLTAAATTAAGLAVYQFWNSEYFTGGLVLLSVYNFMWGILHHRMDKTLNAKVIGEYFFITVLLLSILISTHNFGPRIS